MGTLVAHRPSPIAPPFSLDFPLIPLPSGHSTLQRKHGQSQLPIKPELPQLFRPSHDGSLHSPSPPFHTTQKSHLGRGRKGKKESCPHYFVLVGGWVCARVCHCAAKNTPVLCTTTYTYRSPAPSDPGSPNPACPGIRTPLPKPNRTSTTTSSTLPITVNGARSVLSVGVSRWSANSARPVLAAAKHCWRPDILGD
ncbi:hypothetical protein LZ32DRAFT_96105 [Colletotrichum eremochloae]|nr:hypothetical protein LZ32DRAFT_96105 [Colletotrichum eremochloae]